MQFWKASGLHAKALNCPRSSYYPLHPAEQEMHPAKRSLTACAGEQQPSRRPSPWQDPSSGSRQERVQLSTRQITKHGHVYTCSQHSEQEVQRQDPTFDSVSESQMDNSLVGLPQLASTPSLHLQAASSTGQELSYLLDHPRGRRRGPLRRPRSDKSQLIAFVSYAASKVSTPAVSSDTAMLSIQDAGVYDSCSDTPSASPSEQWCYQGEEDVLLPHSTKL